ncbi:MAG: mannose-1-phosphate guanylyltransferase [Chloroflexia bacterium]
MYVVIPAGGSGTRLWPLSRAANPKFLHPLTGDERSMIQATAERLAPLAPPERTFIVTGGAHAAQVARQLPELPADNILVEPGPRDSAPAIGLAAALIHRRDPEAIMGSFASDHLIRDEERFREVVRTAAFAASEGFLMTIGIQPTGPETGYGYIRRGEPMQHCEGSFKVEQFKEKPTRAVAEEWVASGQYSWNAGMFVWQCAAMLAELERQQPELHAGLLRIAECWGTAEGEDVLAEVWPTLPRIPIDTAIMEGAAAAGKVGVVAGDFGWNDVGDWDTLATILAPAGETNVRLGCEPENLLAHDTERTLVASSSGRLIATLGVRDLVIVDTADALLVCARDRAQDVKKLVDALKARENAPHL